MAGLITVAEAKARLPLGLGSASTSEIEDLIEEVSAEIAQYLRYEPASAGADATILSTAYVLYLDGPGGSVLQLPGPIVSVTSIYDDPLRVYGSDTLVAAADYDTDARKGQVILKTASTHGAWGTSWRTLKVTATLGYATVPSAIKSACKRLVALRYGHGKEGASQESKGGASVTREPRVGMPADVAALLDPYVLHGGAVG